MLLFKIQMYFFILKCHKKTLKNLKHLVQCIYSEDFKKEHNTQNR